MKGPEVIQVKPLWLAVIVSVCGGGTLTLLSYAVLHLRNRFCKDLFNGEHSFTVMVVPSQQPLLLLLVHQSCHLGDNVAMLTKLSVLNSWVESLLGSDRP